MDNIIDMMENRVAFIRTIVDGLDTAMFLSVIATVIDEYAKKNNINEMELHKEIYESAKFIHEAYGNINYM